jgi:hypothetical protein
LKDGTSEWRTGSSSQLRASICCNVMEDRRGTSRFSKNRDKVRVSSKRKDIVFNPLESKTLIKEPSVSRAVVFDVVRRSKEPESSKSIVDGNLSNMSVKDNNTTQQKSDTHKDSGRIEISTISHHRGVE